MAEMTFYMDETGNRQPDKNKDRSREGRDWFALGGFLINREDEEATKWRRDEVARELGARRPFHITDMLAETKGFSWLGRLTERDRRAFWIAYQEFLCDIPVVGFACVIDRPGYGARGYIEKHGDQKWLLCRSAFDIAVERAVKYARLERRKLRIVFESDPPFDPIMKGYFAKLKEEGLEFDAGRSGKYQPLSAADFRETLTTVEARPKSNRLLQLADSYIYAIARGRYERKFSIWRDLCDHRKIANFAVGGDADKIRAMGIKYYCFDS
ncbi:DUF3800 domain-containing protein [Sphingopyxis sp. DHUNG17]|uniref:DUF3800 domain-containing protein n=1 Tax=Sphingopyxis jiangsuensis TaxID=2871171 RepID=UPI00191D9952|nr:DUF3800 domain-containing protein [Sphingopyxis lutea]MBL0769568.1 DUF3800 domain-containing protein [Sphingopyxis lutea]